MTLSLTVSKYSDNSLIREFIIKDCLVVLVELKAYVNFINNEVMKLYTRFDNLCYIEEGILQLSIRFYNL